MLFVVFWLRKGVEANQTSLAFQNDGSNVAISNIEETNFLVMILKRKFSLEQIEESMARVCHYIGYCNLLTSCYFGAGQHFDVLNLLRKSLQKQATNMLLWVLSITIYYEAACIIAAWVQEL